MTEKLNPAIGYVGNALRSAAKDHITSFAEDTFEEGSQKYQSEINDELRSGKFDKESVAQESGDAEDKVMSQKAVSEEIAEVSIVNCNKLPGYSYTSIFTLQEAISAVPVNKRYAAKGITYIDTKHKVHLALFNSISYNVEWENPENWIDMQRTY